MGAIWERENVLPRVENLAGEREGVLLGELLKERFCVFKVCRVKPLSEPVVDFCQQLPGFFLLALLLPQASEARRSSQLP